MMEMIAVCIAVAAAGVWLAVRTGRKFLCRLKGEGGCNGCGKTCPLGTLVKKRQSGVDLTVDGRDV